MKNKMATSSLRISERETTHAKLSTEIAEQGIVLLENKWCLPFDDTVKSIALFGSGSRNTMKGGTGSGDVNVREFITVEQGLINSGYEIVNTKWLNEYDSFIQNARGIYNDQIRET